MSRHSIARRRSLPRPTPASTFDILAGSQRHEAVPRRWLGHYRRLLDLRARLTNERGTLSENARPQAPEFSQHIADAGTDSYDRDVALGLLSSEQNALYEIDAAINRIRRGAYGICEVTGKRIAAERLKAIPWTRFSTEAEKQLEKDGSIERPHLGGRENLPRHDTQPQVGEEQS